MYEQEWVQLVQSAHVATKGTALGNIPVFLFPDVFGKEKPQNGGFPSRTLCRRNRCFGKGQRRVRC
jgi:hypothetical protein